MCAAVPAAELGDEYCLNLARLGYGEADRCHVAAGETQQNQQPLRVSWGVELATTFNDLTALREARPLTEWVLAA